MSPRDWLRARAKALRAEMNDNEKAMWRLLNEGDLAALNFRRQASFGSAVLDFVSQTARLVIEVDPAAREDDASRAAWLDAQGYRVLRFVNGEALSDRANVRKAIRDAALETASARMQRWTQLHSARPQDSAH
jgi:very-short-patch-repair endonuclease